MTQNTQVSHFGTLPDGTAIHGIHISHQDLSANILTYGATVQDLRLAGHAHPLVLGAPYLSAYLNELTYAGALVGRYANRIAQARYEHHGEAHALSANFKGKHCLHGGDIGSGQMVWQIIDVTAHSVTLGLNLPDGNMGFPGKLDVRARFCLTLDNALCIEVTGTTTKTTPCSFAHHSYFNLDGSDTIDDHRLDIVADRYLAVDPDLIPMGAPVPVSNTAFDYRHPRRIEGQAIDHTFCLDQSRDPIQSIVTLTSPRTGITLEVSTNQPGVQIYTADHFIYNRGRGLGGRTYGRRAGLAIETQHWPDAPNRSDFPDPFLHPHQTYHHICTYRFKHTCADFDSDSHSL